MILLVIIALAVAPINALPARSGCSVSIKTDLKDPQPLVLVKKGLQVDFLNPIDTAGTLNFAAGEEFRLACLGSNNYLVGVGNNDIQDIAAYCVSDKTFLVNSAEYEFSSLVCRTVPLSVTRRTGATCLGGYTQVEIGFDLGNEFLRTLDICRDESIYRTYYTKFNLTKSIGGYQSGYVRPSWRQDDHWGPYNVNTQYTRAIQRATVSTIVNSTTLGAQYISSTSDYYFARGHITARADFVYGAAMWSTFWYINSAPQWQTFNGQNWNSLEQDVRTFASKSQLDLDVYTGIHGQLTLADSNGVQQDVYFYASGEDRALSIPLFFWKVIYDPISRTGTAFVGINDPYTSDLPDHFFLCTDISSNISWLTWTADSVAKGISYACTIDDLRKSVPTVPQLNVTGILV